MTIQELGALLVPGDLVRTNLNGQYADPAFDLIGKVTFVGKSGMSTYVSMSVVADVTHKGYEGQTWNLWPEHYVEQEGKVPKLELLRPSELDDSFIAMLAKGRKARRALQEICSG